MCVCVCVRVRRHWGHGWARDCVVGQVEVETQARGFIKEISWSPCGRYYVTPAADGIDVVNVAGCVCIYVAACKVRPCPTAHHSLTCMSWCGCRVINGTQWGLDPELRHTANLGAGSTTSIRVVSGTADQRAALLAAGPALSAKFHPHLPQIAVGHVNNRVSLIERL